MKNYFFIKASYTLCLAILQLLCFSQKKYNHTTADSSQIYLQQDTTIASLVNKIKSYTLTIDRNNAYLKREVDLHDIIDTLPSIENQLKRFKDRLEKGNRTWNLRGLNSTTIMLKGTAEDLTEFEAKLYNHYTKLTQSSNALNTILKDSTIYSTIPNAILNSQMQDVNQEAQDLDTAQKKILATVNILRNRVMVALLQVNDIISDLSYMNITQKKLMWYQEEAPLFSAMPTQYKKPFAQVVQETLQRIKRNLTRYCKANIDTLGVAILLLLFSTLFNFFNLTKIKKLNDANAILQNLNFTKLSIWIASLFGLFTYAPLLFANPTMSFLHVTEFFRILFLTILLLPNLSKTSKLMWFVIATLWLLYAIDDLLLESAFAERWWLFILGILLAFICIKLLTTKKPYFKTLPNSLAAKPQLFFSFILAVASLIFNFLGRVTLTKIMGVTAIQSLVLAISLKVFCTLVLESIYMQIEAYKDSSLASYINFDELKIKFKKILWIIAITIWMVYLIRDIALYDFFKTSITHFFDKSRNVGSLNFSFKSVAIFFVIIWVSTLISKFINFLFGQKIEKTSGKRSSLGSMILLIRLSIWTIGFFIAIAASGIPLDKLSIMIGALSVGIGFGLQNIVNNLVSGIILAFEQPIQVGDQIEVGTKTGVVKEIGVRSSTLRSGDGADIIIPNGDLLSQHLINWTLQNRNRRVEFTIGISYLSNIGAAKSIIEQTLTKNDKILHTPLPSIIVKELGDKTIDMSVMFWVPDLSTAGALRSIAMINIYEALKNAGIKTNE